jgi:hypothetical protein
MRVDGSIDGDAYAVPFSASIVAAYVAVAPTA